MNYLYIYNITAMTRNSNSESTPATSAPAKDTAAWYTLSADECTRRLEVDPDTGLGTNESAQRLQKYGHNELAEAKRRISYQSVPAPVSLAHADCSVGHDASQYHYPRLLISIAAAQVVPGDIVLIREGDRIPTDGRLT